MKKILRQLFVAMFCAFSAFGVASACTSNQIDVNGTCVENKFSITTTNLSADTTFKFKMSAAGVFYVDWGDENTQTIDRTGDTTETQYTHTYSTSGVKTIKFGGVATGYSTANITSAIRFGGDNNTQTLIAEIDGSLGAIFPTLNDGTNNQAYQPRFYQTFNNATNLTSLPSDLFNGINGTTSGMFNNTFSGCTGLTSLPSTLFKGINGSASYMFNGTFRGCTALTSVPYNLFAGVSGTPGTLMFNQMFYHDSNLNRFVYPDGSYVSYVPPEFFGRADGTNYVAGNSETSAMYNVFAGTGIATTCPADTTQNITGFESDWSSKVSCKPDWPFSLTTTNLSAGSIFKFQMSAAGVFTVDWGDGNTQTIDRTGDTTLTQYTHTFATAGSYTIKFGGRATGYNSENFMSAIAFGTVNSPGMVASISGSIGAIFPTLNNGQDNKALQPQFYRTFAYVPNLTSLPANLFDGVFGASYKMFDSTFAGCSGLTAIPSGLFSNIRGGTGDVFMQTFEACHSLTSIPEDLFSGITAPIGWMFYHTFKNCTGLTTIPSGLFKNMKGGAGTSAFLQMFMNCTSLTSIPSGLFSGVTSAYNSSFSNIFAGCTSLTSVPYDLFGNLSGTPGNLAFGNMFNGDTSLSRFVYPDGSYVSYIPPEFFGNLSSTGYVAGNSETSAMYNIFNGTGIATSCPNGTVQNITGFEDDWSSKVSCEPSTITINWGNGNGGIHASTQCTYGGDITTPVSAPTKRGYRFIGWVFD